MNKLLILLRRKCLHFRSIYFLLSYKPSSVNCCIRIMNTYTSLLQLVTTVHSPWRSLRYLFVIKVYKGGVNPASYITVSSMQITKENTELKKKEKKKKKGSCMIIPEKHLMKLCTVSLAKERCHNPHHPTIRHLSRNWPSELLRLNSSKFCYHVQIQANLPKHL